MVVAATAFRWWLLVLLLQLWRPWGPPIPTSLSHLGLGGCSTVLVLEKLAKTWWRQGGGMLLMERLRWFLFSCPVVGFHTTYFFLTFGFHLRSKDSTVSHTDTWTLIWTVSIVYTALASDLGELGWSPRFDRSETSRLPYGRITGCFWFCQL